MKGTAKLRGLIESIINKIVYAFNVCRSFVKAQTDSLNERGKKFVDSAQTDLSNLKTELIELWNLNAEQKKSVVIFIANIIGKALYTPCIVLLTILSAAVKLSLGFLCMTLGGHLFSFLKRFAVIVRDAVIEGFKIFGQYIKNLCKIIYEAAASLANKIGIELARLGAALINSLANLGKKIASAFKAFGTWISNIARSIAKSIAKFLNNLGEVLAKCFRSICKALVKFGNLVLKGLKNLAKCLEQAIRNIATALVNVVRGIEHLVVGIVKATLIIMKGVALSVAALFFETGIATAVSGIAKSIFILEESIAAAIDALVDGVYGLGSSLVNAAKSLVKSKHNEQTELSEEEDLETTVADVQAPTHIFVKGMRAVNTAVANVGNTMLHSYQAQKLDFTAAREIAEPEVEPRYTRSNSRLAFIN